MGENKKYQRYKMKKKDQVEKIVGVKKIIKKVKK